MKSLIGKKVIVRADKAGVFFGTLADKNGLEVKLTNCRKLYRWYGANTVEDLADKGVTRPNECNFTIAVSEMEVSNYIQILPCTQTAIDNLESVKAWKA